jgi:4-hydroxy-3-polyprenylbenzoate decarboxylase
MVAWQVLGNTDPVRDHNIISPRTIMFVGSVILTKGGNFSARWPNVVCSGQDTIKKVDEMWDDLGLGGFIASPSIKAGKLLRKGQASIEL